MNLTKRAALYGVATLAALGLAAGQMATAQSTPITSFSNLQGTYTGWGTPYTSGNYADTQNNSGNTIGATSVTISPSNSGSPLGGNASALLFTDTGTSPSAAFEAFQTTGITTSSADTVSFQYNVLSTSADPTIHLYYSDGTSNPFASAYSQTVVPTLTGWNTVTFTVPNLSTYANNATDANGWTVRNKYGNNFTGFKLYGFGVTSQDHSGSVLIDNIAYNGNAVVNFATPEPASWAAFAFMGLGTAALMFKARKRKALGV